MENWHAIAGFEGLYEVSDQGRVRSLVRRNSKHREFLHPIKRLDGYHQVGMVSADGTASNWLVHRLVLLAFRGQPGGLQGAHLNGDRADNRLDNLMWATAQINADHRIGHGTSGRGEQNSQALVTAEVVQAMRAEHRHRSRTHGCIALGRKYGLKFQTVWSIVNRKTWKHVA